MDKRVLLDNYYDTIRQIIQLRRVFSCDPDEGDVLCALFVYSKMFST